MFLFCCLLLIPAVSFAQEIATKAVINQLGFFGLLFALMYLFVIRPQNKKNKDLRSLLDGLKIGDEVLTTGGLVGIIAKIEDQFMILQINNSSSITLQKQAIVLALPKGTMKTIGA